MQSGIFADNKQKKNEKYKINVQKLQKIKLKKVKMYKYIRLEVRWLCEYDLWNLLGVRKKIWGLMEIGRNEM